MGRFFLLAGAIWFIAHDARGAFSLDSLSAPMDRKLFFIAARHLC